MVKKFYQIKEKKKEDIYQNKERFFFKKKMKILNKKIYQRKINYHFLIIGNKKNKLKYPRILAIIKKKYIKSAVKRNKIKRIIYETFRIKQHKIKKTDYLIIIKNNILFYKKKEIWNTLIKIWKKHYK